VVYHTTRRPIDEQQRNVVTPYGANPQLVMHSKMSGTNQLVMHMEALRRGLTWLQ
jgi:hypothetical protein